MCALFSSNGTPTQNGEPNEGEGGTKGGGELIGKRGLELGFAKEAQGAKTEYIRGSNYF